MTTRIRILQIIFALWGFLVISRLFFWQVVKASELRQQAALQYSNEDTLPASRGTIRSSDGTPFATNVESYMVAVNPRIFPSDAPTEDFLIQTLSASDSARQSLLSARNKSLSWLTVAHHVPYDTKKILESKNFPGLMFEYEPSRSYPEGSPSAYLTGFVGRKDTGEPQGYFGLEGYYDLQLKGRPGKVIQEKDALNLPILIGGQERVNPHQGSDLIVSIDRSVEFIIYEALKAGLEKYGAAAGTVSVMDSATGRLLGMASLPGYDPSKFFDFDPELYKNPIISDGYEPGSTFKVIIMAAAIDSNVVTPDTVCNICTGPVSISGYQIGSWDNKYYPDSVMTDVILHSDNVGMVFVSRKLGKDRMLDYIKRFGFGKLTGIDLQEESTPTLKPNDQWYEIDWATAAFGQGIAVTRLQMLAAVNTLAQQGKYRAPRIVTQISNSSSHKEIPPANPVQIISPKAASTVTQMMINGVENGSIKYYKPKGYKIAGKTGTAQIPIAGHYDRENVVASFVGFAPADNPKFTMLVTLQNPKTSQWGSQTAAPLWFDIASSLFKYYRIPPTSY